MFSSLSQNQVHIRTLTPFITLCVYKSVEQYLLNKRSVAQAHKVEIEIDLLK